MMLTKFKIAVAVMLASCLLGPGIDSFKSQARGENSAAEPPKSKTKQESGKEPAPVIGIVTAVDANKGTITIGVKGEGDKTFELAKDFKAEIDGRAASGLAGVSAGLFAHLQLSGGKAVFVRVEGPVVHGGVKAVDAAERTITISSKAGDQVFQVAKDAPIILHVSENVERKGKLAGLPTGAQVRLRLAVASKEVIEIQAEGPTIAGVLKGINAAKGTLTIAVKGQDDKALAVDKRVRVEMDNGKEGTLAALPKEALITVKLSLDQKTIVAIYAEGPTVFSLLKGKAVNDAITVGNKVGDQVIVIAKDAPIVIEETKAGKLADLIDGTVVFVTLAANQQHGIRLRAEGPSFQGTVKVVEASKNTLTLTIGAKNGQGGQDKVFRVTKDTVIVTEINAAPRQLTDLKNGREVLLRLTLDQNAAGKITLLGE